MVKTQVLKIRLKANSSKAIDIAAKGIIKASQKAGCKVAGPIPLPMNVYKITVNRSPHIDSKSKEQFEVRDLSRLIVIYNPGSDWMKSLSDFHLPPGVSFKVLSKDGVLGNDDVKI